VHKGGDRRAAAFRTHLDVERDAVLSMDDAGRFGPSPVDTVEVGHRIFEERYGFYEDV
jgi:hypothetical protein